MEAIMDMGVLLMEILDMEVIMEVLIAVLIVVLMAVTMVAGMAVNMVAGVAVQVSRENPLRNLNSHTELTKFHIHINPLQQHHQEETAYKKLRVIVYNRI